MDHPTELIWRVVMGAAALMVLGFFLFSLQATVGPFILFLVLLGLLTPFRGWPGHALLVAVLVALMMFWVLDTTGFLLAPFVLALVLAYVLDPIVDLLQKKGLSRSLAIVILALPVAVLVVLGLVFGLPALGTQIGDLIEQTPALLGTLADSIEGLFARVGALTLPGWIEGLLDQIRNLDADALIGFLRERQAVIARAVQDAVLGLGRGLGSVLTILGYVVLTPVLSFYLLRDWDRLTKAVTELIPPGRRPAVTTFFGEYDRLLSKYLRGQVTVALSVGIITAVLLAVARFPYALTLGAIVAVFSIVPYLGLLLSLIPAVLIALLTGSAAVSLLKVAVVYGVAQGLEGAVISPRIVGDSVGLHPVWIVFALAVGGYFFGFVGLLIGVPVAVGVKLLVLVALDRYRASRLYQEGTLETSGDG